MLPPRLRELPTLPKPLTNSAQTFYCFALFTLLLTGYYVLRPLRDEMNVRIGAELLPWMFTAVFVVMVVLQPIYGALAARLSRRALLLGVFGGVGASFLLFERIWAHAGITVGTAFAFAVFVSVINLFFVAVFWSFMADLYDSDSAVEWFPRIALGGTVGAFIGPTLTATLVHSLGQGRLLWISACLFAAATALALWLSRRSAALPSHGNDEDALGGSPWSGIVLLVHDPLLRRVALLLLVGVLIGSLLYFEQLKLVRELIPDPLARTQYFAAVDLGVNTVSLICQALLAPWLMRRFGPQGAVYVHAALITLGFFGLVIAPVLLTLAIALIVTRGGNFGLTKPAHDWLFTRVDREPRYKAKSAIDTMVYRGGDALAQQSLRVIVERTGSDARALALAGIVLCAVFAWQARSAFRAAATRGP